MARYYDADYELGIHRGRYEGTRGVFQRVGDEVRSWFGDEGAEWRRGRDEYEHERRARVGEYWRPKYAVDDMRAGDLMSRNVATVYPDNRAGYAARLMRDYDCGSLPVVDREGRLIGVLTDRDIVMRFVANEGDTHNTIVADCMTDGAFACHADDSIRECLRQMSRHQIRRLPIVNDWGQVVGVLSQSDVARHAGNYPGRGERRAIAEVLCAISEPRHMSRR